MPFLLGRVYPGTRGPLPKIGLHRIVPPSVLSANALYHIVVIMANKIEELNAGRLSDTDERAAGTNGHNSSIEIIKQILGIVN